MSDDPISTAEAELDAMVSDTFGAKKGTLAQKLRKFARRMPRGVARGVAQEMDYLEQTRKRIAHPRRRGQVDTKRIAAMTEANRKSLGKIDVARDKARERINWLGVLVINLMLFAVVYFALLRWLGAI